MIFIVLIQARFVDQVLIIEHLSIEFSVKKGYYNDNNNLGIWGVWSPQSVVLFDIQVCDTDA